MSPVVWAGGWKGADGREQPFASGDCYSQKVNKCTVDFSCEWGVELEDAIFAASSVVERYEEVLKEALAVGGARGMGGGGRFFWGMGAICAWALLLV